MSKRPAYQWYPGDVRRDTAVQSCSFEARGLWREMLDVMHDGKPYGHLTTTTGIPIGPTELAGISRISVARVLRYQAELEKWGVFSRTEDGVIYSRRMVKDEHIRTVRAEAGKLGAESGKRGGRPGFARAKTAANAQQNNPPSVSSSVSSSNPPSPPALKSGAGTSGEPDRIDKLLPVSENFDWRLVVAPGKPT